MKYIFLNILCLIGLFGLVSANTTEIQDPNFPEHEQEMTIELDRKDVPLVTTKEQREIRYQQKQDIKNKILELYKDLKDEKKDQKKPTKHQIAEFKKQLRTINTKIAYSYTDQIKRFFGLK